MKVVVIGALGKVARHLVPLLADAGDEVVGIVRRPEQIDRVADLGADPVLLDVENASAQDVETVLHGADAVVWSAGAGGGNPARTYAVDRDAAIRSMDAAQAAGVRRYVMVSWIGSTPDHGVPEDSSFFPYADAKLAADDHLRGTDLDWTVLGPGTLTDDPATGRIGLVPEGETVPRGGGRVPRADVAQVAAQALREPATVGRFVRFGSGDILIAEALRSL
ncbi:SDR family oxidoreductase [Isoptericola variabilis]|uniref:NAD-dependent epimerase/dehydratase n=1 Tax=Isoptericola variabilis (strain 225) TaxID=743718 RepID=F6FSA8_ISOV2|nr:SDR family oxidoreductase [Isoptericola variabilis]AEG43049.1 NAD-dependent epimerase/dehydratase [Isoptericola variabilis 225]TWH29982.1 putative NAD(P)-binding protein [Isoptericola variabilis J7]